ncbi:hypothetical protein G9A89_002557 [Geosiphon pyriformis]|nr:hypothetical protein G9A89_002557 [Geosiphon pyriformis]
MTDFGLSDGYRVHNGLDQKEVFSLLLWRIFYDPLLCKMKRHGHLCRYRIDSKFIAKSGRIEASGEKTFFLAVGTFVDDMIWVGSSQASMQYILNIANKFFVINNISINNDKTVTILINQKVKDALLLINGSPILIAKKSLRAKAGLPCDFLNEILYYPSLYGLKPFKQVQSEGKLALLILFSNGHSILGHLFDHRFLDLQVLRWFPLNPLQFSVRLYVSPVNNFLAEVHFGVAFSNRIFDKKGKIMDWKTFQHWKQLDPRGPVPYWFSLMSDFMNNSISLGVKAATATKENVLSVLDSDKFSEVCDSLLEVWFNCIKIYTDGSLRCAGSVGVAGGVTTYFSAVNAGIEVKVAGLLSSTLIELQAVVLALKDKNISIEWVKIKEYLNVLGNIGADMLANKATSSSLSLPVKIWERFLVAEKTVISGNVGHFARDFYQLICCAHWKAGLGFNIVPNFMIKEIDWNATVAIWHSDSHMLSGFTSRKSANLHTYLIKAVYK